MIHWMLGTFTMFRPLIPEAYYFHRIQWSFSRLGEISRRDTGRWSCTGSTLKIQSLRAKQRTRVIPIALPSADVPPSFLACFSDDLPGVKPRCGLI